MHTEHFAQLDPCTSPPSSRRLPLASVSTPEPVAAHASAALYAIQGARIMTVAARRSTRAPSSCATASSWTSAQRDRAGRCDRHRRRGPDGLSGLIDMANAARRRATERLRQPRGGGAAAAPAAADAAAHRRRRSRRSRISSARSARASCGLISRPQRNVRVDGAEMQRLAAPASRPCSPCRRRASSAAERARQRSRPGRRSADQHHRRLPQRPRRREVAGGARTSRSAGGRRRARLSGIAARLHRVHPPVVLRRAVAAGRAERYAERHKDAPRPRVRAGRSTRWCRRSNASCRSRSTRATEREIRRALAIAKEFNLDPIIIGAAEAAAAARRSQGGQRARDLHPQLPGRRRWWRWRGGGGGGGRGGGGGEETLAAVRAPCRMRRACRRRWRRRACRSRSRRAASERRSTSSATPAAP